MLSDIQLPPTYVPVLATEQTSSDNFNFGRIISYDTKENLILDQFELFGGTTSDRNNTEKFFKDNPFVADHFSDVAQKLSKIFNEYNFHNLKLEYLQIYGENSELFLIVKTKKPPEEAMFYLKEFDKWFVPNIFTEFTRFNVNIEFV